MSKKTKKCFEDEWASGVGGRVGGGGWGGGGARRNETEKRKEM